MKMYLIYNLDSEDPIGICEAIREDWARYEAADKNNLRVENLFALDISGSLPERPIEKNSGPKNPPVIPTLKEWLDDDTACWMNFE